jgi:hypothetical protein
MFETTHTEELHLEEVLSGKDFNIVATVLIEELEELKYPESWYLSSNYTGEEKSAFANLDKKIWDYMHQIPIEKIRDSTLFEISRDVRDIQCEEFQEILDLKALVLKGWLYKEINSLVYRREDKVVGTENLDTLFERYIDEEKEYFV